MYRDSGISLKKELDIMSKRIFVSGSVSIDNTVFTNVMPSPGVTAKANSYIKNIGGKGANQAIQAHLLGADIFFFASVGLDEEGLYVSEYLKAKGLNCLLKESNKPTGEAFITINELTGENQILIVQGANLTITNEDYDSLVETMRTCNIFLTQLETPIETVVHSLKLAKELGLLTILNPAPYGNLPKDIYPYIDYLVPNEHELEQFVPNHTTFEDKATDLLKLGVRNVIVTLGEKGSMLVNKEEVIRVEPYKVNAVDTTAAGDSYLGALVSALSDGKDIVEAMKFASKCSSITVTRKGAIESLPSLDEII